MAYSTDYNKIYSDELAKLDPIKKSKQDSINTLRDNQALILENQHASDVKDLNSDYLSAYQKNAVQKLINEKQVAERNVNLGLTDSGLNRVQQTAVQLSYANQKAALDISKQKALDTLANSLTAALFEIEKSRTDDLLKLNDDIVSKASKNAGDIYKSNVDANTALEKANIQAAADVEKAKIQAAAKAKDNENTQHYYKFSSIAGNSDYIYYNSKTGKTEQFLPYMNPYTGDDNTITYRTEFLDDDIGFFDLASDVPGYQPRGLKSEGGRFMKTYNDGKELIKIDPYNNGKNVHVWASPSGKYFVWDGPNNVYRDITREIEAIYPKITTRKTS